MLAYHRNVKPFSVLQIQFHACKHKQKHHQKFVYWHNNIYTNTFIMFIYRENHASKKKKENRIYLVIRIKYLKAQLHTNTNTNAWLLDLSRIYTIHNTTNIKVERKWYRNAFLFHSFPFSASWTTTIINEMAHRSFEGITFVQYA